jgi:hypothetical protein
MGFVAPITLSATVRIGESFDPQGRQLDKIDVDIKHEGDEENIPKNEEES